MPSERIRVESGRRDLVTTLAHDPCYEMNRASVYNGLRPDTDPPDIIGQMNRDVAVRT